MVRLLLFAPPGGPIYEVGDRISSFHDLNYFAIEKVPEFYDSYFTDKIPSVDFDTGDFSTGSSSQHMVRDPASMRLDKSLQEADASIPDSTGYENCLDREELFHIFQMKQGVIATDIPDLKLIDWATHVVFLEADEKNVIDWFSDRRFCTTCKAVYHLEEKVPKDIGRCDRCGSFLVREDKDSPSEIQSQFKAWRNSFWKFEETAKQQGKFKKINVDKTRDFDDLCSRINLWVRKEIRIDENWWEAALEMQS